MLEVTVIVGGSVGDRRRMFLVKDCITAVEALNVVGNSETCYVHMLDGVCWHVEAPAIDIVLCWKGTK